MSIPSSSAYNATSPLGIGNRYLTGKTPAGLLLAGIAECAWVYLVVSGLVALTTARLLSPWAVIAPYAVGAGVAWGLSVVVAVRLNTLIALLRTLCATIVYLTAWAGCVLAVIWSALYQDRPLMDPAWISQAMADTQGRTTLGPAIVWLVGLGILMWWRGSYLARGGARFQQLLPLFTGGAALLMAAFAFGLPVPLSPDTTCWLLATYLLFGMAALAETRSEQARAGRLVAGERRLGGRGRLMALLLLAAGFGLSILLLPALQQAGQWVHDWLVGVLFPMLLVLWNAIAALFGRSPAPLPVDPAAAKAPSGDSAGYFDLPDVVRSTARMMFNLGWIGTFVYAIYIWISKWFRETLGGDARGPERERMAWHIDLHPRAVLRWLLRALAARWPALLRWDRLATAAEEQSWGIRELYRRLLAWGSRRGCPRERWTTPREYASALSNRWPLLAPEFELLTESYLRARYGGEQLGREELSGVLTVWQRISNHRDPSRQEGKKRGNRGR